jgi:flagellar hook-associated protein 3 FlgL
MRVTQSLNQTQFLTALDTLESNQSQTLNQLATGLSFSTPSDNPVGAGNVNTYNQVLAQSQQYSTNANSAQTSLNTEDSTLSQVQTQLQSLRSLALEANSGTATGEDLTAIAAQATQIQSGLVALANTQDGNGQYIFSGFTTQTQPYTLTAAGATYAGDQGQQQVQIAAGQTIAAGDSGDAVFNQIKTGNGTFAVSAAAGNTGTGVVGSSTVANPNAATGAPFTIDFTAANTYQVTNATNDVVAGGAYTAGQNIAFSGLNVNLGGAPKSGDTFAVTPGATSVAVAPAPSNSGTATVNSSGYTLGAYKINFLVSATTPPTSTYQVLNAANVVQASGTYAAGQPIGFGDVTVALNGNPANGDSFAVSPGANATYSVTPATGNTGSGSAGSVDYPGTYSINFLSPTTYQELDANHTAVTSGSYTAGQAISFAGAQVTLTGTPAANDSFAVAPSSNQSLFTTVQNLISAIQSGAGNSNKTQLNNAIASGLNDLDQAISHTSTVQANVGGRLNAITTQLSVQSSQQIQLKSSISSIQGLDYAAATTTLEAQNTTLSAALQSYTLTQGLTLFKYIS